jgi:predicted nucleotidyltransferase
MLLQSRLPATIDDAELQALAARYGNQELALFGSVLRDDFRPDSDLDLLVTFRPDGPVRSLLDYIGVKQDLEALVGRPSGGSMPLHTPS